jgi:ATP-dependent 26S proteasome regulatory subunit
MPAQRSVPPTRYSDVLGQNAAVEAARDLIEPPVKHADLFLRIVAKPIGHGIILAGPPGTRKTLLARAVAGECSAHIEIVNGPALLSKWVGETEAATRDVVDRAQKFAQPSSCSGQGADSSRFVLVRFPVRPLDGDHPLFVGTIGPPPDVRTNDAG